MENELIECIDKGEAANLAALLDRGANATKPTINGRSAVGHAAHHGHADLLEVLLRSCGTNDAPSKDRVITAENEEQDNDNDGQSEPKKMRTPDDTDGLQWDEEIPADVAVHDDEGSKLYVYYAQIIEKTGDLLNNTIRTKDPHCLDTFKYAPIHYAAMSGHAKCVQLLLDHRCPVNLTNNTGMTPLHLAVKHPDVVQTLLANNANPNLRNFHTFEQPLHRACEERTLRSVELLLDAGSQINGTCKNEKTPLMLAAANNSTDIATVLMDRGAQVNRLDASNDTALYTAFVLHNLELTERLLRKGARCLVRHFMLHHCVQRNWQDMLQLIIAYNLKSVNIRDDCGWTPLYLAIYALNAPICRFLFENGALLNSRVWFMKEIQIIIQHAEKREKFGPTAFLLLQNGVDIDECNYWDETPLMQAIMVEKYQIAEFLVKEGADINVGRDERCPDCLMLVRRTDNVNLMRLLINAGMDFHCIEPADLQLQPGKGAVEKYMCTSYRQPLDLQQLARIAIRNRIVKHVKHTAIVRKESQLSPKHLQPQSTRLPHMDGSMIKHCVAKLGLPQRLQAYLYDFTDVPAVQDNYQD